MKTRAHPVSGPISRLPPRIRGAAPLDEQLLCELEWRRTALDAEMAHLKKLRAEFEEASRRMAAFQDQAPIGYIKFDQRGHIFETNAVAARLLGFEQNKLMHLPLAFLVYRPDLRRCLGHLARCREAASQQVVTEVRLQGKDRVVHPVQLVSAPVTDRGRKMFLTALVDLTERHKAEEELARAKEFSESIVETIREPLAVMDSDLKVVSVNRAFANFFQKSPEAIKGQFLEVLMNLWWSGNELRTKLEKVLLKNSPLENYQIEITPPNLGKHILLLNARRLYEKEKVPRFILVALEDVTARREAEDALQKTNDELEKRVEGRTEALQKSNKQMESFCYSIAHDLREPLRSMANFSHLLGEECAAQLGDDGQEYVTRIKRNADRMDRLIQDLLNYGRLNTVAVPLVAVNLEDVFREVMAGFQARLEISPASIQKKKILPSVLGHELMLQVALTNLISNAVKFVAPGVRPKVVISAETKGNRVRIWVKDNGIGIDPADQESIFEVFRRLHSNEAYPGTGIGLALVIQCIERIGGKVGVQSTLGKGSRFWIEVPKAPE